MYFEYECPACGQEMTGEVGEIVECPSCGRRWNTDWDYVDAYEGNMTAWVDGEAEPESDDDGK